MRLLLALLLLIAAALPARAQDFVTVGFHDVVDREEDQDSDAITTAALVRFFDWMKGNGWTAISLDDLEAARAGTRPLPKQAILLTFDDGYASVYTRVYPLLLAYRYPAIVAVVGKWMAGPPGSMVAYGDRWIARERFLTWEQIREMNGSGLVEIASHSYALHETVPGNPQGNLQPAAATWRYDPKTGSYEDDGAYRRRLRTDFDAARAQIEQELGKPPRALVWPFGRYTGPALAEAKAAGFRFAFNLKHAPDRLDRLDEIARIYPVAGDRLGNLASEIVFPPRRSETVRIACLTLDRLASTNGAEAQNTELGRMIEAVRALGANALVLDAQAKQPSDAVFFPTRLRPVAADLLGRVVWQMRTRAGVDAIYLRLPSPAETGLYADMFRAAAADGLVLDSKELAEIGADAPPPQTRWDRAALRDRLDPAALSVPDAAAQWTAYKAAEAILPDLRLMLTATTATPMTQWPAPLADILLLPPPPHAPPPQWLDPSGSGRVALMLPASGTVDAMQAAQRRGATAFALCPGEAALELPAGLAQAFSSASFPLQP